MPFKGYSFGLQGITDFTTKIQVFDHRVTVSENVMLAALLFSGQTLKNTYSNASHELTRFLEYLDLISIHKKDSAIFIFSYYLFFVTQLDLKMSFLLISMS